MSAGFYVVAQGFVAGPFDTPEEAKPAQDRHNRSFGLDPDGEGYCAAVVLHCDGAFARHLAEVE